MALLDDMTDDQKHAILGVIISFRALWNGGTLSDTKNGTMFLQSIENLREALSPPPPPVADPPDPPVASDDPPPSPTDLPPVDDPPTEIVTDPQPA